MVNRISSVENILRRVKVSVNILSKFYTGREEKYAFYRLSDNASIGSCYTLLFPFVDFHYEKVKLFHNFMFCCFHLTNDVACSWFALNILHKTNFNLFTTFVNDAKYYKNQND